MYVYQAILLTAPRLNSIKPEKPEEYPSKPIDLHLRKEEEVEEEHIMTDEEIKQSPEYIAMIGWANHVNKKRQVE